MKKTKLKTLREIMDFTRKELGESADEITNTTQCGLITLNRTLYAHQTYLLQLEERVAELEKKLEKLSP